MQRTFRLPKKKSHLCAWYQQALSSRRLLADGRKSFCRQSSSVCASAASEHSTSSRWHRIDEAQNPGAARPKKKEQKSPGKPSHDGILSSSAQAVSKARRPIVIRLFSGMISGHIDNRIGVYGMIRWRHDKLFRSPESGIIRCRLVSKLHRLAVPLGSIRS